MSRSKEFSVITKTKSSVEYLYFFITFEISEMKVSR